MEKDDENKNVIQDILSDLDQENQMKTGIYY